MSSEINKQRVMSSTITTQSKAKPNNHINKDDNQPMHIIQHPLSSSSSLLTQTPQPHPFANIAGNLYHHLSDLWKVSDSMGAVSKSIYKDYRETCLSLEECERKRTDMETDLKQLMFDRDYMETLKRTFTQLRKENQMKSQEMDRLMDIIRSLNEKNKQCEDDKRVMKKSFEEGITTMANNIQRYSDILEKLKASATNTNKYMKQSTDKINTILEDYCDEPNEPSGNKEAVLEYNHGHSKKMVENQLATSTTTPEIILVGSGNGVGGQKQQRVKNSAKKPYFPPPLKKSHFKILSKRKRTRPVSIRSDLDSVYDMNNYQWAMLSECIHDMNKIMGMNREQLQTYFSTSVDADNIVLVPSCIQGNHLERVYLLFLKEIQHLKKIPNNDFLYLKELLSLPPDIHTLKDLKDYLADDMYRLNNVLVTM